MSKVLGIQNACGSAINISSCYSVGACAASFWSAAYSTLRYEGQVCSLMFSDKTLGCKTPFFCLKSQRPKSYNQKPGF